MTGGKGLHRVRWASSGEPEMQCAVCFEFLPITAQFWLPTHGLRRCRACLVEANRPKVAALQRKARADPVKHAREMEAERAAYRANVESRREYARNWFRRNRSALARAQRAGIA